MSLAICHPVDEVKTLYRELTRRQALTAEMEPRLLCVTEDMVRENPTDVLFLKDTNGEILAISPRCAEFFGHDSGHRPLSLGCVLREYEAQHRRNDVWCMKTRRTFVGTEVWYNPAERCRQEGIILKIPNIRKGEVVGVFGMIPLGFVRRLDGAGNEGRP